MSREIKFRAKKIDSDKYVEGFYFPQDYTGEYENEEAEERNECIKHFIHSGTSHDELEDEEGFFEFYNIEEVDKETLAIHFPNMLDSDGRKIFASISEDGKGGDIVKSIFMDTFIAVYNGFTKRFEWVKINTKHDREMNELSQSEIKIIGVQK